MKDPITQILETLPGLKFESKLLEYQGKKK